MLVDSFDSGFLMAQVEQTGSRTRRMALPPCMVTIPTRRMSDPGTAAPNFPGAVTRLSPLGSSTSTSRLALLPYPNAKGPGEPVLESASPWRMDACRIRGLAATSATC